MCHGCALEKQAPHFMPDRRSKDGLMNYCRECCLSGTAAAANVIPRRPGRPPRAAALLPLTHKVRAIRTLGAPRGVLLMGARLLDSSTRVDQCGRGMAAGINWMKLPTKMMSVRAQEL